MEKTKKTIKKETEICNFLLSPYHRIFVWLISPCILYVSVAFCFSLLRKSLLIWRLPYSSVLTINYIYTVHIFLYNFLFNFYYSFYRHIIGINLQYSALFWPIALTPFRVFPSFFPWNYNTIYIAVISMV